MSVCVCVCVCVCARLRIVCEGGKGWCMYFHDLVFTSSPTRRMIRIWSPPSLKRCTTLTSPSTHSLGTQNTQANIDSHTIANTHIHVYTILTVNFISICVLLDSLRSCVFVQMCVYAYVWLHLSKVFAGRLKRRILDGGNQQTKRVLSLFLSLTYSLSLSLSLHTHTLLFLFFTSHIHRNTYPHTSSHSFIRTHTHTQTVGGSLIASLIPHHGQLWRFRTGSFSLSSFQSTYLIDILIDIWAYTLLKEGCQFLNILLSSSHTQSPLIVSVCLSRIWGHCSHQSTGVTCWGRKFFFEKRFLGMKNSMKKKDIFIFLSMQISDVLGWMEELD